MANPIDIKDDLPMSMTMAAFVGISWYIGVEINISLFLHFKRRRGRYFWSCALCSWGVVLQPLFIILADFDVWTDLKGSVTMIYLTWLIMVVPQSWVLYSRLHLITQSQKLLRWITILLLFNSIVFSIPTVVIGILIQATDLDQPRLANVNTVWGNLEATVFFVQETLLSILYIWQTHKLLRNTTFLQNPFSSESSSARAAGEKKRLLYQLIYTNLLVIALDIALLGIRYGNLFYLQGAFKPCVYGVKLKVEYVILNRLVKSIRARKERHGQAGSGGHLSVRSDKANWWSRLAKMSGRRGKEGPNPSQNIRLGDLSGKTLNARGFSSQESQVPIVDARTRAGDWH